MLVICTLKILRENEKKKNKKFLEPFIYVFSFPSYETVSKFVKQNPF